MSEWALYREGGLGQDPVLKKGTGAGPDRVEWGLVHKEARARALYGNPLRPPKQNDRHDLNHYLPATLLAGDITIMASSTDYQH